MTLLNRLRNNPTNSNKPTNPNNREVKKSTSFWQISALISTIAIFVFSVYYYNQTPTQSKYFSNIQSLPNSKLNICINKQEMPPEYVENIKFYFNKWNLEERAKECWIPSIRASKNAEKICQPLRTFANNILSCYCNNKSNPLDHPGLNFATTLLGPCRWSEKTCSAIPVESYTMQNILNFLCQKK